MINNQTVNALRFLSADAVEKANSGHPGMPLGMADIAEVLWRDHLNHNQKILYGLIEIDLFFLMGMVQCFFIVFCIFLVMIYQ